MTSYRPPAPGCARTPSMTLIVCRQQRAPLRHQGRFRPENASHPPRLADPGNQLGYTPTQHCTKQAPQHLPLIPPWQQPARLLRLSMSLVCSPRGQHPPRRTQEAEGAAGDVERGVLRRAPRRRRAEKEPTRFAPRASRPRAIGWSRSSSARRPRPARAALHRARGPASLSPSSRSCRRGPCRRVGGG